MADSAFLHIGKQISSVRTSVRRKHHHLSLHAHHIVVTWQFSRNIRLSHVEIMVLEHWNLFIVGTRLSTDDDLDRSLNQSMQLEEFRIAIALFRETGASSSMPSAKLRFASANRNCHLAFLRMFQAEATLPSYRQRVRFSLH